MSLVLTVERYVRFTFTFSSSQGKSESSLSRDATDLYGFKLLKMKVSLEISIAGSLKQCAC